MIIKHCSWLNLTTVSGLSQLLKRVGISYKQGRDYVHSPDPDYEAKLSMIELMRLRSYFDSQRYPFLYLDELTYYRQPTVSRAYESQGREQPLARRSYKSDNHFRVLGALNAMSGQLSYRQRKITSIPCFTGFWYQLRDDYPQAEEIYVVVDNWPVHFHPDVLAPLQDQNFPFPPKLPASWSSLSTSTKAKQDNLPIQLLCLPTYASWLNPIEKLWRWLKQDVIHLHRLSGNWPQLRERVDEFLVQFSDGSDELLRYVGLLPI